MKYWALGIWFTSLILSVAVTVGITWAAIHFILKYW